VRNKEIKAENNIIKNMLRSGISPQEIAESTDIPLSRVLAIEETLN
jgi:hypothetical protein